LVGGQHATVLQMPASPRQIRPETEPYVVPIVS
jgi:hypothetical protein